MKFKLALAVFISGVALAEILEPRLAQAETKIVGSISTKNVAEVEFPKLAKLSLPDAIKTAKRLVPGKVVAAGLECKDGYLVYAVEFAGEIGGLHEIIIDAGDGRLLANDFNTKKSFSSKHDDDLEEDEGDDED